MNHNISYGKLTPEEFRANLAQAGIQAEARVEQSRFPGNGLYVNPQAKNIFYEYSSGEVDGIPYEMFVTPCVLPLTFRSIFYTVVFVMELPYDTASVYIESRTRMTFNNFLGISTIGWMRNIKDISLEGDFNRYFNVFAQDGHEVDAVTTLAPNMMLELLESQADFDIEFAGRYVYLYKTLIPVNGRAQDDGSLDISLSIKSSYEYLHTFGVVSAKQLLRFARPTREETYGREPFWKVVKSGWLKNTLTQLKWYGYYGLFVLSVVLFNVYALAFFAIVMLYRFWQWYRGRKRLLDAWHRDPESVHIRAKSKTGEVV